MKLDKTKVRIIKELFLHTESNDSDIAAVFNVTREHINLIRNNHRWVDFNEEDEKVIISKPIGAKRSNDFRDFGVNLNEQEDLKNYINKVINEKLGYGN
jgi:NurA-like 5'-3' nuclease